MGRMTGIDMMTALVVWWVAELGTIKLLHIVLVFISGEQVGLCFIIMIWGS